MSTLAGTLSNQIGFSSVVRKHPLIACFVLAYAGMWIVISPLVMDSFGWIELSDGLGLLLFVLSSLSGLFTPLLGPFTIEGFIVFVVTAAAGTFIYLWVFNNTRGSVWLAMVLHASSNAASQLVSSLIPQEVVLTSWMKVLESGWINVIIFSALAILLVVPTRGRFGYMAESFKTE